MAGYRDRVIHIPFPDLSEPEDPIYIIIRNPKRVDLESMIPKDGNVTLDANGMPVDSLKARRSTYEVIAELVVGWHVYDATAPGVDDQGNLVDQPLLPLPATAELVAKLPMEILNVLADKVKAAQNPQ